MTHLIETLKHFAKAGSGPINDACAQAIDEIERLQKAKRGALQIANERSKENVGLRADVDRLAETLRWIIKANQVEAENDD